MGASKHGAVRGKLLATMAACWGEKWAMRTRKREQGEREENKTSPPSRLDTLRNKYRILSTSML